MPERNIPAAFWSSCGERVEAMTAQWLRFEGGDASATAELGRTLHTFKGEAYMFGLDRLGELSERVEDVIVHLPANVQPSASLGDAILSAFELLAGAFGECKEPTRESIERALSLLDAALLELPPEQEPATRSAQGPVQNETVAATDGSLAPERVQPVVAELRRLRSEREVMETSLREAHRMLRALLAELDPTLAPALLAVRITKTLGYGWDIERRIRRFRSDWSASELELSLLTDRLSDDVHGASMVAVSSLRDRAERLTRTTATALGKAVRLDWRGDAYVPATVIRALEPMLVHILRNAVDHGIDSPAERISLGKTSEGCVSVDVASEVGWVSLSISDDGGGVDVTALRRIVPGGDTMSDDQVLQTIFRPGVTVRTETTAYSGRGVGLDVVATEMERLGGRLAMESELGIGTRFVLKVPTSVRTSVVVPVTAGPFRCALPAASVATVLRGPATERLASGVHVRAVLGDAEQLVPRVSLARVLGASVGAATEGTEIVAVVTHRGAAVGFILDSYESPRAISVEPASELAISSRFVSGAATSADGVPVLVLSPEALIEAAASFSATRGITDMGSAPRQRSVVVAEDAPVARELLVGLLRSFGLHVREAEDGRSALELLEHEPADLLITDIEMPRMSGLELMAAMRARRSLANIPVVVLTTRTDGDTRRQAADLGAQGYISKRKFVESDLREAVDRCLEGR